MESIDVRTRSRVEMLDITPLVQAAVKESGVKNGVCHVFVPHTTAGVTINEGADPDVVRDIIKHLAGLVPHTGGYKHQEGNSDAHIKTALTGSSETVFVEDGRLVLGTWQAVYLCEFDGPRQRKIIVKVMP